MATDLEFVLDICRKIEGTGNVSFKKMFGEYLLYLNGRPVFLFADNTLFVKQLPIVSEMLADCEKSAPYDGAKEHYVIEDIGNAAFLCELALKLEKVTPLPKPRKKKTQ